MDERNVVVTWTVTTEYSLEGSLADMTKALRITRKQLVNIIDGDGEFPESFGEKDADWWTRNADVVNEEWVIDSIEEC